MAKFSLDIVSNYDKAEMNNVFDQTKREISSRYDLKNTKASIDWLENKVGIKVLGDNDFHIEAILDIFRKKLASRSLSQKVLDLSEPATTSNLIVTQVVKFKSGINKEQAKKMTSLIRDTFPKVNSSIQGEEVRVMSPKKDELQAVMNYIKNYDFDFPVAFTNFR
ncbi:YajQ family cyclic di-GMP-binding protein [Candidatus Saccharibacteria bacterium]|jgi:uncharacterized protein YajQ (UPF0234 family)|nr:YajQ family cyclic di-GMP-binding protein [Candidatus Saccharibacteria bacterium]